MNEFECVIHYIILHWASQNEMRKKNYQIQFKQKRKTSGMNRIVCRNGFGALKYPIFEWFSYQWAQSVNIEHWK